MSCRGVRSKWAVMQEYQAAGGMEKGSQRATASCLRVEKTQQATVNGLGFDQMEMLSVRLRGKCETRRPSNGILEGGI